MLSQDRPHSLNVNIPSLNKQVCNNHVSGESNSLSLRGSLNQCLRSCMMRRSGVCSIISPFVQSGGDLNVDEDFVACPLTHTKLSRRVAFSLSSVINSSHRSASPSLFSRLTLHETRSNTHDIPAIRPDLKVSVLHSHRSDCCQKLRTVVSLLTPRLRERAIPVHHRH